MEYVPHSNPLSPIFQEKTGHQPVLAHDLSGENLRLRAIELLLTVGSSFDMNHSFENRILPAKERS